MKIQLIDIIVTTIVFSFLLSNACADSITRHVGKDGNVVYSNTGPTQQDIQSRAIETEQRDRVNAEHTAKAVLSRHPELSKPGNPQLEHLANIRDHYVSKGYSVDQALLKAERQVFPPKQRQVYQQRPQQQQQVAPRRELFTKENSNMGWKSRLALNKQILRNSKRTKLIGKAEATKLGLGWQARMQMNEQIIANQGFVSGQRSNNDTSNHEVINNSQTGQVINNNQTGPEWDTQGRHYTPAGGGNLWRNDGTLMQKAAGGYIDTKTGQFVPAN